MEEGMLRMTLHKHKQAKKITFAANQACNGGRTRFIKHQITCRVAEQMCGLLGYLLYCEGLKVLVQCSEVQCNNAECSRVWSSGVQCDQVQYRATALSHS